MRWFIFWFVVDILTLLPYFFLFLGAECVPLGRIIRAYDLLDKKFYSHNDLEDYERMMNYTFSNQETASQIYVMKNVLKSEMQKYPNCFSQNVVFQHYHGANLAMVGVNQKGKFHKPVRSNFPPGGRPTGHYAIPTEPSKYHSLQIYNKVVVGFSYHLEYGHFLLDCMAAIFVMPSEILDRAEIFIRTYLLDSLSNYTELLGFDPNHVHQMPRDWIYCNDLYFAQSEYGTVALHAGLKTMQEHFFRVNGFDKIKPVNHVFINKFKGAWGHILNIDELCNWSRTTYPQYNWVTTQPTDTVLAKTIGMILAGAKILITGPGSLPHNSVFLHPKSGMYIMGAMFLDVSSIASGFTLSHYVLTTGTKNIVKSGKRLPGNFPLELYNSSLPLLMEAVYTGKWPSNISSVANRLFNYERIYNGYKKWYGNRTNMMKLEINKIESVTPWCARNFSECAT